MHLEILVEEPSAEAALLHLVPRILPGISHKIFPHQGKQHLLRVLPNRMRGYARWLPADWRVVVVVDADRDDCRRLKSRLEEIAASAGLITRSSVGSGGRIQVLNRIAIEELEAWFFGDLDALRAAYPSLSASLAQRAGYRNPDAIRGGTWQALERELQRAGYYPGGLPKIEAARAIASRMAPDLNRSHSFQAFRSGLLELAVR
jgi:hypothetical protein